MSDAPAPATSGVVTITPLVAGKLVRVAMERVDWQGLFFDAEAGWPNRLMARARRRFGDSPDAEAAYNHALDAISAHGWRRLDQRYRGSGSAEGFLTITFLNLLEEYAVRKYGRRRPPAWVRRLGPPWTRIFELLCLRRQPPEAIVDLLNGEDGHDGAHLRSAIREVRGRIPDCGSYTGEEPASDATPEPGDGATPLAQMERGELGHLLATLSALLGHAGAGGSADERTLTAHAGSEKEGAGTGLAGSIDAHALTRLAAALELEGRERLLLRLVYQENCTIPEAARHLGLNERTARRVHGRTMERLRAVLGAHGFLPEALTELSG